MKFLPFSVLVSFFLLGACANSPERHAQADDSPVSQQEPVQQTVTPNAGLAEQAPDTASSAEPAESDETSANDIGDESFDDQFDDSFEDEFADFETAPEVSNPDKLEKVNRAIFAFNMKLDRWILKPAAQAYQWLAPEPVELGVSNFFFNLLEIRNVLNDVLQWKWKQAANDTGRFLMNSTVGIAGLFDVARHAGMERSDGEDFGQTLAVWGVPQGPYLMLPILGPYTVTAAAGMPVDWGTNPVSHVDSRTVSWSMVAVDEVQSRAQLLEAEKLASGDLYIFIRDAYLQRREFLINDGVVEDDFGGDFGEEDESFDF